MEEKERKRYTFTYELDDDQQAVLYGTVLNGNYKRRDVPYSLWSIDGDGYNVTLYKRETHGKRKLSIQGKKAEDFILYVLEPNVLGAAQLGYETVVDPTLSSPHAGSDESGKGDYFGPLVVCCAYVDEETYEKMKNIGVRDCKQMSDKSILRVGTKLRSLLGENGYAIVKLGPAAYNRLYSKMKNINKMLAWAHATAIEELLQKQPECKRVVVDQFARSLEVINSALKDRARTAEIDQHHKAESDMAVAAASVIAREMFLRDMMRMSEEAFGPPFEGRDSIPCGSSDARIVTVASKMIKRYGAKWIMNHAKAHFQTTETILSGLGLSRDDLPPEGRITSITSATISKDRNGTK